MKHFIYITLIIIAGITGYWIGQQSWFFDINNKPYWYNTQEALNEERAYANAMFEGLHWWYRQNTNWWEYQFKNSPEYNKIDSINQGDWEDFYAPNWK